ncbi:damage-control phosphatase ARMT1-like [Periplaneta americana]|uniref:damage-control phosphatase ARMT1-like n=1 Tax=Periplaneta americana TaxID=6978 RepID=UPI0037E8575C
MSFNDECIDVVTPANAVLSAKYMRSFAYITLKDRLPVTITKVIDHLVRDKEQILSKFGEIAREELKEIIGSFSKLKNELQTNKPFQLLSSDRKDVCLWNAYYQKETEKAGEEPRWYRTSWLYSECYMYRRMQESFEQSVSMKTFDPFRKQKREALLSALSSVVILGEHVLKQLRLKTSSSLEIKNELLRLVKVNLWGNQHDLSLPVESLCSEDPIKNIDRMQDSILVDDSECIWTTLMSPNRESDIVDFVNDNAGYELFTDFCLADALCTFTCIQKVRFHVKALPWFVSDTTEYDFHWVLRILRELSDKSSSLAELATRWEEYLHSGRWIVEVEDFWTLPHVYHEMKDVDPNLYTKLSEAALVIFKGDLNYRKLLGETNWLPAESFATALQGFHPAPLVTLRTVKADLICGLKPGLAECLSEKLPDWMVSGKYAVIQFHGL